MVSGHPKYETQVNLVERIARMIDTEGAYAEAYDGTGEDARLHELTTRQKYFRAAYELKATQLLKMTLEYDAETIKKMLIEFEMSGWRELGVPVDDPLLSKIVAEKYR